MGGTLSAVGSVVGIASGVNSLLGGSGGGSGGGTGAPVNQTYGGAAGQYIPAGQPQADQQYQDIFNNLGPYTTALPGQVIPRLQTYASNIQNNPYAAQQMAGANQVAALGQGVGASDIAYGNRLGAAGNQILDTAFDPQNALYNRTQNQIAQQAAAANANSGVTGPYAAGVTNQALGDFNLNWQDRQLGRQAQGEQIAGQAYSGAAGLGTAGLGTIQGASSLPYTTYLGQQNTDIGALSSLTAGVQGAINPAISEANLLQSYLGLGQTAERNALIGQNQGFQQSQLLGQQFGTNLQNLGNSLGTLFGSPSGDPYPGGFANYSDSLG